MRADTVKWLRNNLDFKTPPGITIRDEIMDFVRNNNMNINSVNKYLQHMEKNKTYAGQIEIYAVSNILNKNIRTFIKKNNKYKNIGLGYQIKNKDINDDIIYIII